MGDDFRKQWFRERILSYLGENDPKLLYRLINSNEKTEDGNQFDIFLNADADDVRTRVFTVYKTFYSTTVEEEVVLDKEVQQQSSGLLPQQDDKKKEKKGKSKRKGKRAEIVEAEEKIFHFDDEIDNNNGKSSKKKKRGQKKSGRSSPYTMMDNLQQDDRVDKQSVSSFVPVKKTVQKVVELPQIQYIFGGIDKNKLEPTDCYVYFIKKKNQAIPSFVDIEQTNANMPSYFYVGCLGDDIFNDLQLILESMFIPIFQKQHLAAKILPCIEDKLQTLTEITSINTDKTAATRNKPSCYFVNFKYNNGLHTQGDYVASKDFWDDPICADFNFTEELTYLTRTLKWTKVELDSQKQSPISVPHSIDELLKINDEENDDVRKEALTNSLSKWTQSLDSFTSNILECLDFSIDLKSSPKQDLLTEYYFWRETEMKIATVNDTLNGNTVHKIMMTLQKHEKCMSVYEFVETKKVTLKRLQELASENADILHTHRAFFETFINGDFKSVTKIIPRFVESLKSVWLLSKYYGEEKNMLRLLLNIKSTLCNRVKNEFEVTVLFKTNVEFIKEKREYFSFGAEQYHPSLTSLDFECALPEINKQISPINYTYIVEDSKLIAKRTDCRRSCKRDCVKTMQENIFCRVPYLITRFCK